MKKSYFVTGTDTDVGKTFIAAALLEKAKAQGLTTAAIKPVSAGCELTGDGLRNDDALILQRAVTQKLDYQQINPIALEPAIAPHIAAAKAGKRLDATRIAGFCRGVMSSGANFTLIEGAGGWRVPLNERQNFSHLAVELGVPVILVVAMRLGCINHALLTAEAIQRDGLVLAGWVANAVSDRMTEYEANRDTLARRIPAPLLGEVPFISGSNPADAANYLDLGPLGDHQ
ncbi:MAG: dethiobiotin synthase [bacterium]